MTNGRVRTNVRPRWRARGRVTITRRCEWDWPPERRYLRASPTIIDVDLAGKSCAYHTTNRRIADVVLKGVVLAVKIAVAIPLTMILIFCVWLICTLLSA